MRWNGKPPQLSEDAMSIIEELARRVTILESSLGVSRLSEPITARITGIIRNEDEESGNFGDFIAYRWVRLFEGENGTVTMPGQIPWRGAEDNPARERSGKQDVPIDGSAIVNLFPSEADPLAFIFDWADQVKYGKITGHIGGGVYNVTLQVAGQDGVWEDDPSNATITAFEANGQRNFVTNGTVVDLRRGYCSGAPRVEIETTKFGDGAFVYTEQSIRILDVASGTYRLLFTSNDTFLAREWTSNISYSANATVLQGALSNISIAGGSFSVAGNGTNSDPFLVTFPTSSLYPLLEADESKLKSDQEWTFFPGREEDVSDIGPDLSPNGTAVAIDGSSYWPGIKIQRFSNGSIESENDVWMIPTIYNGKKIGSVGASIGDERELIQVPVGHATITAEQDVYILPLMFGANHGSSSGGGITPLGNQTRFQANDSFSGNIPTISGNVTLSANDTVCWLGISQNTTYGWSGKQIYKYLGDGHNFTRIYSHPFTGVQISQMAYPGHNNPYPHWYGTGFYTLSFPHSHYGVLVYDGLARGNFSERIANNPLEGSKTLNDVVLSHDLWLIKAVDWISQIELWASEFKEAIENNTTLPVLTLTPPVT